VTGSAHTVLSPYWAQKLGKDTLRARQCSPRGGDLSITVGTQENRVYLTGQACIVIEGTMRLA
jgi:predicted PhzF superfamily epimerase YddE/YHI9